MDISFGIRKLRKSIASLTILSVLFTLLNVTGIALAADTFSDVPSDHYAHDAIAQAADLGWVSGIGDGRFDPSTAMTRAQVAKVVTNAFELETTGLDDFDPGFPDMPGGDLDLYVKAVASAGIMTGNDDGTFGSNDPIQRQDFALITYRALGVSPMTDSPFSFPDVDSDDYFYEAVGTTWWWQIINGYDNGRFGTGDQIIRADAVLMLVRATGDLELRDVETEEPGSTPSSDGDLEVELSDDTPDGGSIPNLATSVAITSWDFTANGDDVIIDSLEVHQFGVSSLASGHAVYLYEGSERLTSSASINSSSRVASFYNLDFEVEEGETRTITARLNVGNNSSDAEVGFELENVDAIGTNADDVDGDFPVGGDLFDIKSGTSAGVLTIEKNGTITNPKVGAQDATIAKFQISAATEAAAVQELGIYIDGSVATGDVENFKLYRTGESEPLAEVDGVDSQDVARFVLDGDYDGDSEECDEDGYCIEKGASRTFYVTADFNTGRNADTVKAYIDEDTDILAVGSLYGFGMSITDTNYDGNADSCASSSSADCSYSALEGGDITITKHNIDNTNLAVNQEDAVILNFTITSESRATFDNFVLRLDTNNTVEDADTGAGLWDDADDSANYTDIRIREVGGSFVYGPVDSDAFLYGTVGSGVAMTDATDDEAVHYIFTDDLTFQAGQSREFEVVLDVENNTSLADDSITASVYIDSSYPTIKDTNNKTLTNADSVVPTATFNGDSFTVKSNSLGVVLASGAVGSATEVIGQEDAELAAFTFSAGDANDITVTSVQLTGYYDTDSSGTFTAGGTFSSVIERLALYEGSVDEANKISSDASANSSGEINFNNLNWDVDAGTNQVLYVAGDFANNSSYDGYRVKVDIADVSADVVAEDERGNAISSTSADTPNGGTATSASYTQMTVSAGGTLSVDVPSSTPDSEIVVAGTSGNEFAELRFEATQESFKVSKLALKNDYASTVGDYDDNINKLQVRYFTDEEQTEEATVTCTTSTTAGVYTCNFPSGSELMVPDPDMVGVSDYATATVIADLNSVANDQADEGDKPAFTLSLTADFEARGEASNKLIEENGTYDLSILRSGSSILSQFVTTNASYTTPALAAAATAAATSLTVDDEAAADPGDLNLVGAILCFDDVTANDTCDASEEQVYVTAVTDGSTDTLTVKRGVNGTSAAAHLDNADILFIAPTGVLATNYLQVQATDIYTTVSSSSRAGSTSSTESILSFDASSNAAKIARVRQGLGAGATSFGEEAAAPTALTAGPSSVTRVSSAPTPVAGTYAVKILDATSIAIGDGGSLNAGAAGLLDDYSYASLWLYVNDAVGTNDGVNPTEIELFTSTTATAADQGTAIGSSTTDVTEGVWLFYSDIAVPGATDASDQYFGLEVNVAFTDAADYVAFDDVRFYNDKVNVDLTLNENWAAVTPTVAYLKQGGTTVATGYLDVDGAVSSRTGQLHFVPVGTYGDIEINSSSETFTVQMNTSTAITNDSDATEQLTATIDLGNVSTTGDFWWYDGASVLNFLGVNSTDKIEVTSSY